MDKTDKLIRSWADGNGPLHFVRVYVGVSRPDGGDSGYDTFYGKEYLEENVRGDIRKMLADNLGVIFQYALVYSADCNALSLQDLVQDIKDAPEDEDVSEMTTDHLIDCCDDVLEHVTVITGSSVLDDAVSMDTLTRRVRGLTEELSFRGSVDGFANIHGIALSHADFGDVIRGMKPGSTYRLKNTKDGRATLVNDTHFESLDVTLAASICGALEKALVDVFMGRGRIEADGTVRLESGKRLFRVAVHYDVAYCEDVRAFDEDEAYRIVREKAQSAPGSELEFLEETTHCIKPI